MRYSNKIETEIQSILNIETIFISLVAAPLGIILSYLFISYFGTHGIDLSAVSEGLEELGIGTRVYTKLSFANYISISILTLVVTFLSSLIPARRALKLNPAEAVRDAHGQQRTRACCLRSRRRIVPPSATRMGCSLTRL